MLKSRILGQFKYKLKTQNKFCVFFLFQILVILNENTEILYML